MGVSREGILLPARVGLTVGTYLGGRVVGGLLQSAAHIPIPDSLRMTVDSRLLGEHLMGNHLRNLKTGIVKEIFERPEDYPLVDLNVVRYVLVSTIYAPDMAFRGIEETEPHIREIQDILVDNGLREPTIAKAVTNVREVLPDVVKLDPRTRL